MRPKGLVPLVLSLILSVGPATAMAQEQESLGESFGIVSTAAREDWLNSGEGARSSTLQRLENLETELQVLRARLADSEEASTGGLSQTSAIAERRPPPAGGAFVPPAPAEEGWLQAFPGGTILVGPAAEPIEYPTVRVTGFFHLDTVFFDQDARNEATIGDIENGTAFRRARLAATGNVTEDTGYMVEFDFAQAAQRFADVWINFDSVPAFGGVRIGRFRQPFGMTELTSIRELLFIERPVVFALSPFRQTGVMAHDVSDDQRMTYAISGYRYFSDNYGNVFGDSGGWGTAARLTWLPYYEGDERLIHVGADYSFNDPARDLVPFVTTGEAFAGQNPEFGPAGIDFLPIVAIPPFANTGAIPTEHTNLINLEAAAAWGPLVVQSEMRWAVVDQLNGARNTFPGFYAHARYVLTGEIVEYDEANGVFGAVTPDDPVRWGRCGAGAWELAARVSHLDLNGELLPGPGRQLTDVTAGLNWYLNRYVKFQFNYIHTFLEDPLLGGSDLDIYAMRGQLQF